MELDGWCNVGFAMEEASVIVGSHASAWEDLGRPMKNLQGPQLSMLRRVKGRVHQARPAMGGRSMRSHVRVRVLLVAPLIGALLALVAVSAPAAQAATAFGPEILVAGNCTEAFKT